MQAIMLAQAVSFHGVGRPITAAHHRLPFSRSSSPSLSSSLRPPNLSHSLPSRPLLTRSLSFLHCPFNPIFNASPAKSAASGSYPQPSVTPATEEDEVDMAKLTLVSKRLENTSRHFKRLGSLGFWSQLVCTAVAAVILSFSVVITGKVTSPATFYATAGGIAAAFLSVFWSFSYIQLADKLRRTASQPSKAPPRAEVVKSLRNGIIINLLGMGASVLGMQATVGVLVAKALTSSAVPYYQGISPGSSPVLALDVFLVQSSANTILSHFLGILFSLELLRSVTVPPAEGMLIPKAA